MPELTSFSTRVRISYQWTDHFFTYNFYDDILKALAGKGQQKQEQDVARRVAQELDERVPEYNVVIMI